MKTVYYQKVQMFIATLLDFFFVFFNPPPHFGLHGLWIPPKTKKETEQTDMMAKLLALQEKVMQMEGKLEESVKKEEELAQKLEEQVQISEELRDEIKDKDEQLFEFENRLKQYE